MVVGTVVLLYHTIWLGNLSYDVYAVYMGYCAGVYAAGKWQEGRNNDRYTTERYQDYGDSGSKHSLYDNPDTDVHSRY